MASEKLFNCETHIFYVLGDKTLRSLVTIIIIKSTFRVKALSLLPDVRVWIVCVFRATNTRNVLRYFLRARKKLRSRRSRLRKSCRGGKSAKVWRPAAYKPTYVVCRACRVSLSMRVNMFSDCSRDLQRFSKRDKPHETTREEVF